VLNQTQRDPRKTRFCGKGKGDTLYMGDTRLFLVRMLLLLAGFCLAAEPALACDQIAPGETLWVRLTSQVSSYSSKPGTPVRAILISTPFCDGAPELVVGSELNGQVRSVKKVGLGVRHETARLEIEFNQIEQSGGTPVEIDARVMELDNARETVKQGVIHGVRSTDTPQGRINSRLKHLPTWNPYSDTVLIVYKAAFPVFPEPEIYLEPGTDVRLELTAPLKLKADTPLAHTVSFSTEETDELNRLAAKLPERTYTSQHKDSDIVNLLFIGSGEQVRQAFQKAGWEASDTVSKRSVCRNFYAYLNLTSYAHAPMSRMLLAGEPADMNWEKTLNSYARRDHLRIWKLSDSPEGETLWASAATKETSATLSLKQHHFVHHVDPRLDEERAKVVRDLSLAGCVEAMEIIARPGLEHELHNSIGDPMQTDAGLAVVKLRDCSDPVTGSSLKPTGSDRSGSRGFRFVRRQVLTFRSDIWRANIIYGTFDAGRMLVTAMRSGHRGIQMSGEKQAAQGAAGK